MSPDPSDTNDLGRSTLALIISRLGYYPDLLARLEGVAAQDATAITNGVVIESPVLAREITPIAGDVSSDQIACSFTA